jgi:multiple sugar transport system substrate-binding protein
VLQPILSVLLRIAVVLVALGALACSRAEASSGPRRIVYWEKWTGFEGEAMDRVVDAFNAKERARAKREPGYRPIEVKTVTISRIEQKLLVAVAGGNPPDVAGIYSFMIASYVNKGALTDLTPLLAEAGISKDDYIPAYFELGEYDGRVWALPTAPATTALHWNKRLFREAGLDPEVPPKTLEELDAFAEKLTKWEITLPSGEKQIRTGYLEDIAAEDKRLIQVGFLPSEPGWWSWSWGYHFGGTLFDGKRVTTADPNNVRAYEWVASYSRKLGVGAVQKLRSSFGNFSSPQNPFLSGRIAMEMQGVWMYNFIDKYAPGMQWGAAPFPPPADRPDLARPSLVEADDLVIPKDSKHPAEAFEFIRFTQTQEALELLCFGQRKHSPLKKVSPEFWQKHPHPYIELFSSLATSKTGFYPPKLGIYNEYRRELAAGVDAIMNLSATPEQALGDVEARMQKAYERELAQKERRGEP